MKKRSIFVALAMVVLTLTACTQYQLVPLPWPGFDNGTTQNTAASKALSFTEALDAQLPEDVQTLINDSTASVTGLTLVPDAAATGSLRMARANTLASETTRKTYTFNFKEYPVRGFGSIETGSFTLTLKGTEKPATDTFTASSYSYEFETLSVIPTGETAAETITLQNLDGVPSGTVTITTTSGGTTTVSGLAGAVTVTGAISSSTSITIGGTTVSGSTIGTEVSNNPNFAGGLGTSNYPYLIETAEQFANIAEETEFNYYELTRNIELPAELMMGEFSGVLSGGDSMHTISYSSGVLADALFWSLMNGSIVRDLTIDLGTGTKGKPLSICTEGSVLIDNVTVKGSIINEGNNTGTGYIVYLGYGDQPNYGNAAPSDLTIRNCINELDVYSYYYWGAAPFVGGYPAFEPEESSLTLENCVNRGKIYGLWAAYVFGNSANVDKIGSVTVNNCTNEGDGLIYTYAEYYNNVSPKTYTNENIVTDDAFKTANLVTDKTVQDLSATRDASSNSVTVSSMPPVDRVEVIGRYHVYGFTDEALTDCPAHTTVSIVLGESNANTIIQLEAYEGVDSDFKGADTGVIDGDFITIDRQKYAYIPDETIDSITDITHVCFKNPESETIVHRGSPSPLYALGYLNDECEFVVKVTES